MLIESTKAIKTACFNNTNTHFNQNGKTFHDILQLSLNNKSNSRPPKIEVTGILVPIKKFIAGRVFKFKLEADAAEYLLNLNTPLERMAQKIQWEEVTIKGHLDLDSNIIEVEKISLSRGKDSMKLDSPLDDFYFDADYYERTIAQRGKLEPDYLAS